ncbi:hypothetical protein ABG067_006575 [Albugo candida]
MFALSQSSATDDPVDKYFMKLISLQSGNSDFILGLRVEVAQIDHEEYVMAFYMNHTYEHQIALQRCWPKTEIKVSLAKNGVEGYNSYDILPPSGNPPAHDPSKRDRHYDPESMRDTKVESMDIIPGCWKMSSSLLENLYNKGKLLRRGHNMMVLGADEFVDLAPRGIYSFEWNEKINFFVHPVNTPDNNDIKLQRDLVFPAVRFGGTKFKDQRIQIHLDNDPIKLPKDTYEIILEKIKAKTHVPSSSKKPEYKRIASGDPDDVIFDNTVIIFPGKESPTRMTEMFRPTISSEGTVNFLSSNSEYWVLGGRFLWMCKVIISTKTEEKMYQITPYEESNVWSKLGDEVPEANLRMKEGVNGKASSTSPFY